MRNPTRNETTRRRNKATRSLNKPTSRHSTENQPTDTITYSSTSTEEVNLLESEECHQRFPDSKVIKCYDCGRLICEKCTGPAYAVRLCSDCEEVFEGEEDYYNWQ